jgi:hypothetical protein
MESPAGKYGTDHVFGRRNELWSSVNSATRTFVEAMVRAVGQLLRYDRRDTSTGQPYMLCLWACGDTGNWRICDVFFSRNIATYCFLYVTPT